MPHCVVEYSKSLLNEVTAAQLLDTVFQGALKSKLFTPEDIKCRAMAYDDYLKAGDASNFVHVIVYILDGRSLEQKQNLSGCVLTSLMEFNLNSCVVTVDVRDMERACYGKVLT